jgi:hypothetical protein
MNVQQPEPAAPKAYRYQTGFEVIQNILKKMKKPTQPKPVKGLVPMDSRPPNDIRNSDVQAALGDDVLRSFIFPADANG